MDIIIGLSLIISLIIILVIIAITYYVGKRQGHSGARVHYFEEKRKECFIGAIIFILVIMGISFTPIFLLKLIVVTILCGILGGVFCYANGFDIGSNEFKIGEYIKR